MHFNVKLSRHFVPDRSDRLRKKVSVELSVLNNLNYIQPSQQINTRIPQLDISQTSLLFQKKWKSWCVAEALHFQGA